MTNFRENIFLVGLAIGLLAFSAGKIFPLTIQLKNGSYLSGEVIKADESGLEFKSWSDDAHILLKWHHFDAAESARLKNILLAGSSVAGDAYQIDGRKIYLKSGPVYEGVLVEKNESHIKVKTISGVKNIPVADILRSDAVKTDPLKVYTAPEWYLEKIKAFDLAKASDNFELAEYCRSFLKLYDKAKEHYYKSAQLSASYKERAYQKIMEIDNEVIQAKGLEVEKLISNKDSKSLEQAKNIIAEWKKTGGVSAETEKMIAALETRIADMEKSMASKTQKETVKKLSLQCYNSMKSMIKKISGQELSYPDAVAYVNTMLYKQIIEKLAKDDKMSEEDVAGILGDKSPEKYDGLPKRESSFGEGSWIINSESQKQLSSMSPEEFARYQKKIRAVSEAKDKAVLKNELIAPETWWNKINETQKELFLESLFAERYMYVVERKEIPCVTCNGEGVINKNLCKRCWGAMTDIIIVYK